MIHPLISDILAAHGVTPSTRLLQFNRARVRAFYEGHIKDYRDTAASAERSMIHLVAELSDEPTAIRQDDLHRRIAEHRVRRQKYLDMATEIEAQLETLIEEHSGA